MQHTISRWWMSRRRFTLLVTAAVLAALLGGRAVTSSPVQAQTTGSSEPLIIVDQVRGSYLSVQLSSGRPDSGRFYLGIPGLGLIWGGTAATVVVSDRTTTQLTFDGTGQLDRSAVLDPVYLRATRSSGRSETTRLHLEAQLNPQQHTGTAHVIVDGASYSLVSSAPTRDAERTLAGIVDATKHQDWRMLYRYSYRDQQARTDENAFVASLDAIFAKLGAVVDVQIVVPPAYSDVPSGAFIANARIRLTLKKDGVPHSQDEDVALVLDGGNWRFSSIKTITSKTITSGSTLTAYPESAVLWNSPRRCSPPASRAGA
jgi:hypothetical protein